MPKPAYYGVIYGLPGCMPDYNSGPMCFNTRRELAEAIRYELAAFDIPASKFAEVGIRKLWGWISRHGSSSAHFSIHHADYVLEFYGCTEEEFLESENEKE